ncbi:MAG: response regulator [Myxococcaceae bacterium]
MTTNERLILVVDDDDHTRELLQNLCESAGFKVALAEDGQEALDKIHELSPDLVLLDLMMPKRDGFSVLQVARENPALTELPIIVLTAMGDIEGKIRGMELGADDYVTKPFKLVELQTRINSALLVRDYRKRLVAAEEELSQYRALDPVTGAGTYSQLKASLDSELARSRRYGRPVAALFVALEDFSSIRQKKGKDGTDQLVAKLASEIKNALRGADRFFRVDSDEFVALLPETDAAGARIAGQRLLEVAKANDVVVRVGGAVFPDEKIRSSEDLLREANRSYRALQGSSRLF